LCDIIISAVYIVIFLLSASILALDLVTDGKRGITRRDTHAGEDAIKPVQHMLWDGHYIADPDIVGRCAER
jgi:hypothetical protein